MTRGDALPPHLSLHLDAVRFLAAATVFLAHFGARRISGGLLYQAVPFGAPAVDVFFVLSGFVISHVASGRERDLRGYTVNRLARLASVIVPACALCIVLDPFTARLDPALFAKIPLMNAGLEVRDYILSLLFLNETWFLAVQPGTNGPYWSMGFEVWYYAIFAAAVLVRGRAGWLLAGLLLLAAGPKIALMLPVWLLGVAAHAVCRRGLVGERAGAVAAAGGLLVLLLICRQLAEIWPLYEPFDPAQHWLAGSLGHLAVGAAFAVHVVGVHASGHRLPAMPARAAAAIRWLAGATFGVYLLHFPLLYFLAAASPVPVASAAGRLFVGGGAAVLAIAAARLAEARKGWWRGVFNRIVPRGAR